MDYSSMKAKQTSRKSYDSDFEISRGSQRKIKRVMKKSSVMWILVGVILVLSALGGFFVAKFAFKNDTYSMVTYAGGEADIYIGPDEQIKEYTELGVKCVSFGKDISADCTVKYYYRSDLTEKEVEVSAVDESVPGIYYAVYSSGSIKYKSVTLIRNIIVTGVED